MICGITRTVSEFKRQILKLSLLQLRYKLLMARTIILFRWWKDRLLKYEMKKSRNFLACNVYGIQIWLDSSRYEASGRTKRPIAEGDSFKPVGMFMRATWGTNKRTGKECKLMLMQADMKESGSRTSSTGSVLRGSQMVSLPRRCKILSARLPQIAWFIFIYAIEKISSSIIYFIRL